MPTLQEGRGGVCREKGCFQQVQLTQTVSWILLQADTIMALDAHAPVKKAGGSAV